MRPAKRTVLADKTPAVRRAAGGRVSMTGSPRPDVELPGQSLQRALDLLEVFLLQNADVGLAQLAAATRMSRATAHRLLRTLEARRYLQRDRETRKYSLGVRVFDLGARFQHQLDIRRAALPELTSLVEQTGQAAFLCIRDGDEALCLERVGARHRVRIFALQLGERQPLHCGAAPRALLSGLSKAELLAYARRTGLPTFTPRTLSTAEQLLRDTRQNRERGFVLSNEDVTVGIAAVGAPVRDHSGQVIASISVSGLAAAYTPSRIAELADLVRATAERLSRQMGHPDPR